MPDAVAIEKCTNCHRIIGSLEKPMLWAENVVCPGCYQSLHNPAGAVGVRAPVKVIPRVARVPYRERVGTRSYIFQVTLIGWTVLVWGGLAALFAMAIVQGASQPGPYQTPPPFASNLVVLGLSYVLMVAFWAWMSVALPLFIAAVATLRTKEEKHVQPTG